jgi:hypothetical protein
MAAEKETSARILEDDRVDYRHDGKTHITESGRVAISNWIGRIGNKRVRVYRGASEKSVPEAVRKAMAASGVHFGIVTLAELGLKSLPPKAARNYPPEQPQG